MKEIKIIAILLVVIGAIYCGVEPYAHKVMHPEVTPPDFSFSDLPKLNTAGDAAKGKEIVAQQCATCHSIKKEGVNLLMSDADAAITYGVVPPDLSNVATMFDTNFLANFIKDPAKTTQFTKISMPALGLSDEDIGHVVAYLKSIAAKEMSAKNITLESCGRCHSVKYDKYKRVVPDDRIKEYLGSIPPDLSQVIVSKGEHYLHGFINQPQKLLHGTSMPRVGLTEGNQHKVIEYLEKVGDPEKEERNSLGIWVIGYFVIFSIIAFLWRQRQFKEVH